MAEFNGLSRGKNHLMYGLNNLDIYCTKKEKIESYINNKYCERSLFTRC